ncbi:RNA 2'-phosphotransferase [Jiangella alba]|uniref:RNA 2'-phosphotransferase, Tpt1 / KptA family n=1 Tax=Jiangella alba TaxID=561176 RepID=A0A1H5J426_9ACTN|nr:RNA 2'-phosphotransferase [Jiangella alba]SEE47265.1 RNA 2'-phosphotransferase, Tpt1 / KptA family [Jiangella alba]
MTLRGIDLTREISHALRHEPWLYELELDDEGWVPVDQILAGLREKVAP